MKVSVCDFRSSAFRQDFIDSVINTGFAVVVNHGVNKLLIQENQFVWKEFFTRPNKEKLLFANESDANLGYTSFGGEKALGSEKADLKEFYHWKPDYAYIPDTVKLSTIRLFYLLSDVGEQLLYILDSVKDTNYRDACVGSNNTIFRALYYPALQNLDVEEGAVRAAAHEDINFITLLVAASAPGLQVMDVKGSWIDVPHEENSIVVNIGDMLQLASKELFKSTTHRVINPDSTGTDRISLPLFIHPHGTTLLADGYTAQEFLNERLNTIYKTGYRK